MKISVLLKNLIKYNPLLKNTKTMIKKNIAILGSTGSVGKNALKVVDNHLDKLNVKVLSANKNIKVLSEQIEKYKPEMVAVFDAEKAKILKIKFPKLKIYSGIEGLEIAASYEDVEIVLLATSTSIGIYPAIAAINAKKTLALANKEVMLSCGELIMKLAKEKNVKILPVDSEHCAIFQCFEAENKESIKRLVLTASGGPFLNHSNDQLEKVTINDALKHPTYTMGQMIAVNSSTLMNKGHEIIEAHYLFGIEFEKIDVIVHPQSLIHSFVEYIDGSMLCQISEPNMQVPIQYSFFYPQRVVNKNIEKFDFLKNSKFEFFKPDYEKFRCLFLAYEALKIKKSMPCFMNKANEVLVERFLMNKISWKNISEKLEKLMSSHHPCNIVSLEDVRNVEELAITKAKEV